ncbi:DUF192 domain-containing protein [Microvirga sp. W0021]|uniref:DUF192 domain-containing protein n=1 Tax=Hohaiivirga grylli TaxID=3133970 RepID=A0ABV0BKA2_9HYPH
MLFLRSRLSSLAIAVMSVVFIATASSHLCAQQLVQVQQFDPLTIVTVNGERHVFKVEKADTDEKRQRGLMFRKELPSDQGMIFDFGDPIPVAMWMKNTYIPLDMIFIRKDGSIARIAENTEPLSTRVIDSGEPVLSVLELAGGVTSKLGIKAGDRVEYPIFKKTQ